MEELSMSKFYKRVGYGSLVAAFLAAFGCSTTNDTKPNPGPAANPTPSSQLRSGGQKSQGLSDKNLPGGQDQSSLDALRRGEAATIARDNAMKDVYFDFDQYNLDEDDRAALRTSGDWLKKNLAARVQIEGHCDERGTSEYNLALGAKRAQAAKDYLVSLGVAETRLSIVSYGEEIPVCQDATESCWKENRRDRFVRSSGAKRTF
jgi:peptidoglycan-associated lipoprotein